MEKTTERQNPPDKAKLDEHYIKIQEVGLSCWLALPFVTLLFDMFHIINAVLGVMIMFVLGVAGFLCLELGQQKRDALRKPNNDGGESWP